MASSITILFTALTLTTIFSASHCDVDAVVLEVINTQRFCYDAPAVNSSKKSTATSPIDRRGRRTLTVFTEDLSVEGIQSAIDDLLDMAEYKRKIINYTKHMDILLESEDNTTAATEPSGEQAGGNDDPDLGIKVLRNGGANSNDSCNSSKKSDNRPGINGTPKNIEGGRETSTKQLTAITKRFRCTDKSLHSGNQGDIFFGESDDDNKTQVVIKVVKDFDDFKDELKIYNLVKDCQVTPQCIGHGNLIVANKTEHVLVIERIGTAVNRFYDLCDYSVASVTSITIVKEMLKSLRQFHMLDLVHLDIKGQNLLLSKKNIKIIDFGLSDEHHSIVGRRGTPMYVSPHVLQAGANYAADKRDDLLSLESVLGEYLLGWLPWDEDVRNKKWADLIKTKQEMLPVLFETLGNIGLNQFARDITELNRQRSREAVIDYDTLEHHLDVACDRYGSFCELDQLDWDERFYWVFKDRNVLSMEVDIKPVEIKKTRGHNITITVGPFYADVIAELSTSANIVLLQELNLEATAASEGAPHVHDTLCFFTDRLNRTDLENLKASNFKELDDAYRHIIDCYVGFGYKYYEADGQYIATMRVQCCLETWDVSNRLRRESMWRLCQRTERQLLDVPVDNSVHSVLDDCTVPLTQIPNRRLAALKEAFGRLPDSYIDNINANRYMEWGYTTSRIREAGNNKFLVRYLFRKLDDEIELLMDDISKGCGFGLAWSKNETPLEIEMYSNEYTTKITLCTSATWNDARREIIDAVLKEAVTLDSNARIMLSPQYGKFYFILVSYRYSSMFAQKQTDKSSGFPNWLSTVNLQEAGRMWRQEATSMASGSIEIQSRAYLKLFRYSLSVKGTEMQRLDEAFVRLGQLVSVEMPEPVPNIDAFTLGYTFHEDGLTTIVAIYLSSHLQFLKMVNEKRAQRGIREMTLHPQHQRFEKKYNSPNNTWFKKLKNKLTETVGRYRNKIIIGKIFSSRNLTQGESVVSYFEAAENEKDLNKLLMEEYNQMKIGVRRSGDYIKFAIRLSAQSFKNKSA